MKKIFFIFALLLLCLLSLSACQAEISPCEAHTFGEWNVTKKPTCSLEGKQVRVCSICQHKEEQSVNKEDHDLEELSKVEPTITKDGYTISRCLNCETRIHSNYVPAKGSPGLIFATSDDWSYRQCVLKSVGDCTDEVIYIPYSTDKGYVKEIASGAFKDCTTVKKVICLTTSRVGCVVDLASIIVIGDEAFSGCTSLESVSFDPYISTIGKSAFANCTALKDANLGFGFHTVGDSAFENCTSLETMPLSIRLKQIGEAAFKGCTAMTEACLGKWVEYIGKEAFAGCTALQKLTWEDTQNWQYAASEKYPQYTVVDPQNLADPAVAANYYLQNHTQVYFRKNPQ